MAKASKPAAAKSEATGFKAPLTPSAALAAVIGSEPVPRTEIVKKMWDYIKANNLQDPTNKRMINADEKLKPIFEKDQVSMFELPKVIGKHIK